ERREGRADAEDHEAEGERLATSVPVGQAAGGQQQTGEYQYIGVDHPLELTVRRAEVLGQRRQRNVQDRVVETDHEQAEAKDPQDPPPPLVSLRVFCFQHLRHGSTFRYVRVSKGYEASADSATPPYRNVP